MLPGLSSPDPVLARLQDEELVVLVQQQTHPAAAGELVLRYRLWVNAHVSWHLAGRFLGSADAEDAQQDAVFAVLRAALRYRVEPAGGPQPCSFRTFLLRLVHNHVANFIRHHLRLELRLDHSRSAADLLGGNAGHQPPPARPVAWRVRELDDPAALAERREALGRLRQALGELDDVLTRLWERLESGISLSAAAEDMGLSYDAAKRLRRRLFEELRTRLGDLTER